MSLTEIAKTLYQLSDELCIFAKRPWTQDSDYELAELTEQDTVPPHAAARGLEYFLEIPIAKEICEVFGDKPPSTNEIARLVIFYAENDAFPTWVYER